MMNKRKQWNENDKIFLFNEVDGFCPLCTKSLMYIKNNKLEKNINIAHIFPHSPTSDELIILHEVEKINKDSEHINNVICLCPECHLKFDKPRTLEEYNKLLEIKKSLIKNWEIKDKYDSYKIEEDIKKILMILSDDKNENYVDELEYNPKTIDNKTNKTIKNLTKRKIKYHVSEFFHIIKHEFKNIDTVKPNKATKIATQIKSFYYESLEIENNQEFIYNSLVEWLDKKTAINKEASSIIISYFIQNCEVFDVIS